MMEKRVPKKVSLKDIAERAGVSVATVSRVLRDKGELSDDIREKVKKIASDLNWRRNLLVQGFQTGKTHLVGVVMSPMGAFRNQILAGIHDVLIKNNYAPIVLWPGSCNTPPTEEEQLNRLLEYRVDGILINPMLMLKGDEYLRNVWQQGVPVVCMDSHMPKSHADYVGHDTENGGRLAAEHFLGKGYTKFAHFSGPQYHLSVAKRGNGFRNKIAETGFSCTFVENPGFDIPLEESITFLKSLETKTAIFADNDNIAACLYGAATELGLNIPDDIAIIGFSDDPIASMLTPKLTTILQDGYPLGEAAASQLLSRINNPSQDLDPKSISISVSLIERESV